MDLTLNEAATRLGCRVRTLRDRVRRGEQPAYKRGAQWMIRPADLPLTEAQRRALQGKVALLHAAVDAAIPEHLKARLGAAALNRLDVFAAGRALLAELTATDAEPQATAELRAALLDLAVGHHHFAASAKVEALDRARAGFSRAAALLWLASTEPADDAARFAARIEADVLPRLGGLIRWAEALPEGRR
ncbi:MAG: helix-turn-helix domain-containing protein [Myxococcales bacterium]|nr:helix-turn-helix domain-containing protein [Myxococcales bacterium]